MSERRSGLFLGIDIGTSGIKAVLVDIARRTLAEATVPIGISRPHPLWSEQDAEDWWQAVEVAVASLKRQTPDAFARIAAIGLSGQMHGAVILGHDHRPLRPVMLWNDGRASAEAAELQVQYPDLAGQLGVLPMAGLTFPKLLWLARHEPETFAAIDCLLLPKDYIRLKLTGELASDMSDAAGTWGFDQAYRTWSDEAAYVIRLDTSALPRLVEGTEITGIVRPEIAARWGLSSAVLVAGGGGDAAVGAVGIGAINEGASCVSLGTSCQLVRVGSSYRPNVESLVHAFAHAVPERWYQMGAMLNGASVLAWGAQVLGREVNDLVGEVEAHFTGPSRLLALHYLAGERTPHNNPDAKGAIIGLTSTTSQQEIAQALMEAVAFSLADADLALGPAADDTAPIAAIGGGARSELWMQMIAAVLNRPIVRYRGADKGPAFGASLLARVALTGEDIEDVAVPPDVADVTEPDERLVEAYQPRLDAFRQLYQVLKASF